MYQERDMLVSKSRAHSYESHLNPLHLDKPCLERRRRRPNIRAYTSHGNQVVRLGPTRLDDLVELSDI